MEFTKKEGANDLAENKRSSYGNVAHALNVLLLFKTESELTLAEMAEKLQLRKSYLLKLLKDLKENKFIDQDVETGKYRLGLTCLELGEAFERRLDIRRIARPYLEELSKETNELVHLAVLDTDVVVLLERVNYQENGLYLKFHLSLTSPPHTTALGNTLMAFSDRRISENYLKKELKAFSPHTITDPDRLREKWEEARKRGYYLDYESFESGISGIGAPIFSSKGKVVAAMSICAPTVRMIERKETFKRLLLEKSLKVSKQLGYKKPSSDLKNLDI